MIYFLSYWFTCNPLKLFNTCSQNVQLDTIYHHFVIFTTIFVWYSVFLYIAELITTILIKEALHILFCLKFV